MNVSTFAPVLSTLPADISVSMAPSFANLSPAYDPLKARHQWVGWKYQVKANGDTTKAPINPHTGKNADHGAPTTWGSYEEALAAARRFDLPGIGFVFVAGQGIAGTDHDHCLDLASGSFTCRISERIVRSLDTLSEISPSGEGVKTFSFGDVERTVTKKDGTLNPNPAIASGLEVYGETRFFTVTGNQLPGSPSEIRNTQPELDALQAEYGSAPKGKVWGTASQVEVRSALDAKGFAFRESVGPVEGSVVFRVAGQPCPTTKTKHYDDWWITSFPDGRAKYGCHAEGCKPKNRWKHAAELLDLDPTEATGKTAAGVSTKQRLYRVYEGLETTLIRDQHNQRYVVLKSGETLTITGEAFRAKLTKAYLDSSGFMPEENELNNLIAGLSSLAFIDGAKQNVFTRFGNSEDGAIWLDLGDDDWQGIRVDSESWSGPQALPPGLFYRPAGQLPLPVPERGGSVDLLLEMIRGETLADKKLTVAWLLGAMRPDSAYPILTFTGEHGSGKSTVTKSIARLIDPESAQLQSTPDDERNLRVKAEHRHVMSFDNNSHISQEMSDAFCRLSTGGAYGTRKMYKDDEERIFDGTRPMIFNSITDVGSRGDFLDRVIMVTLPAFNQTKQDNEDDRKTEKRVEASFKANHPKALGVLLDGVVSALRNLPELEEKPPYDLPRMADFSLWMMAAAPAFGWKPDDMLGLYQENRGNAQQLSMESSPFANELLEWFKEDQKEAQYSGSAASLLELLTSRFRGKSSMGHLTPDNWPKTPKGASAAIDRAIGQLRNLGISVGKDRGGGKRVYILTAIGEAKVDTKVPQP